MIAMKIYRMLICSGLISLFLLPGVSARSSAKGVKGVQYPTYKRFGNGRLSGLVYD